MNASWFLCVLIGSFFIVLLTEAKRMPRPYCHELEQPLSKADRRRCINLCRYRRGDWSECDKETNIKTRNDTLKKASPADKCEPIRVKTKICKKRCKYSKSGRWSECDVNTKTKTKVANLRDGDLTQCSPTKNVTRPCKISRKRLCQYGKWSRWSKCEEGEKSKTRELLKGEMEICGHKTRKIRTCGDARLRRNRKNRKHLSKLSIN